MKSTSYKTKKGISRMTLNHLVKGSNPLRPKGFTTIEDFTLDRSLDRQENHSEANQLNEHKAFNPIRAAVNRVKRHSLILSSGVVTEEEAAQYFKDKEGM